ncbi:keratin-associated protein family [Trichomonas vaginalis G3]|uniref:keratin-associated protein family n=1 Tax=Trichomonas vaginalis (strain ATCC PRA-98 / G3) TaxID=412133 RepID=UPI0021E6013F|nr:keratin-associated protein family [Trichomonas vaginalis G3]KAI5539589.1 keratin-associated protein family [Trichomonas vaginalis G3]
MIENSHLTFKEDTLYNALNAAFAYILGHEQVQNSGIAIYLDKVMLKKPLTFTEDGPKATGIVGDGTLLTKEYLTSHAGEFFSTNDSISTTPKVILLKKPITFDAEGKTKATRIAGDGVLLTKEYLKKNINDFVEVVKDKESGLRFNPLSFIFDIANAGATAASWISLQGQINALWTFIGARDGIQTVTAALELIPGGKGGFALGFKNLVTTVLINAKSAVGFTIHNARMYWQLGTAWLRAIPRDADDKKEDQVDLNVPTVIFKLRELYPSFVEFIKSVNDSISINSITLDKEFQGIDYIFCSLAELAKKVEENKNNGGRTALKIADKADKSYVDEEIRKVVSKEYTLPQSVILKTIKGPEKDMYPGDGTTVKVNERVSFPSGIDTKEVYINGENINTTLIPLKNNEFTEPLTVKSIRSREDKPVIINKIGADNDQPVQIKKIRADDIILNYTLGSSAPLENPSTSVKDTLNSLDNSCRNIEGHVRNFETHELPTMLDKKADKTYVDAELTTKFWKPDKMTFTTEIINGEPATPFEFVRGLQPDTFEFFLDNSIELTLHYKSGTNATFHPGDTFQMVFNDISSLEYVYRAMSIYDLIYPIGAVYTSMNPINPNTLFGGRWYES